MTGLRFSSQPSARRRLISAAAAAVLAVGSSMAASVQAQEVKVGVGLSGWTGFAPLTLAKEAGIFKKNGLDVTLRKIPQKDRHLALASGDIECAATTIETWIVWNAAGVASTQIFQLDKSFGADGMAVRGAITQISDLKGKTVAASAPGTSPYFVLAYMLKKNGLAPSDVKIINLEPQAAANAFVAGAGGLDAAMTYEPYLSAVRNAPSAGKIIATTLDYPAVIDSFGCTPKFLKDNPKAAKALADSYFEALDLIAEAPQKSYGIMGADVKQSAEAFEKSQSMLRWSDRAANKAYFNGGIQTFSKEAAELLLETGIIKKVPDLDSLYDAQFIQ